MITTKWKSRRDFIHFLIGNNYHWKYFETISQKWVNTNLPAFQNESAREIMPMWVKNDRTIPKEIAKLDQWNFLICLYDIYFPSFLTVLRDLISISNLMNNKRTYFNFKMKFAQRPGNKKIWNRFTRQF